MELEFQWHSIVTSWIKLWHLAFFSGFPKKNTKKPKDYDQIIQSKTYWATILVMWQYESYFLKKTFDCYHRTSTEFAKKLISLTGYCRGNHWHMQRDEPKTELQRCVFNQDKPCCGCSVSALTPTRMLQNLDCTLASRWTAQKKKNKTCVLSASKQTFVYFHTQDEIGKCVRVGAHIVPPTFLLLAS